MKKMLRDKRGFEVMSESAVYLILVMAAGIVLFLIAVGAVDILGSGSNFEACQRSIQRIDFTNTNLNPSKSYTWGMDYDTLDCPVWRNLYTLKDVQTEAKELRGNAQDLDLGMKGLVAGEMTRCWRMVGKGENNAMEDDDDCMICNIIRFDKKMQNSDVGEVRNFRTFLQTEIRKLEGEEAVYIDYLYSNIPEDKKSEEWAPEEKKAYAAFNKFVSNTIDPDITYAIFWGDKGVWDNLNGDGVDVKYERQMIGFLPLSSLTKKQGGKKICSKVVN